MNCSQAYHTAKKNKFQPCFLTIPVISGSFTLIKQKIPLPGEAPVSEVKYKNHPFFAVCLKNKFDGVYYMDKKRSN